TAYLPIQRNFIDLNEAVGAWRFILRAGITDFRRHLKSAELNSLIDVNVKRRDAACDFVEAGELRNRIGNAFGHRSLKATSSRHEREQGKLNSPFDRVFSVAGSLLRQNGDPHPKGLN